MADPEKIADFRLRCNEPGTWRSWTTGTFLSKGGAYPSGRKPRVYELAVSLGASETTTSLKLAFDLISFDEGNDLHGWIYLNEVKFEDCTIE